MNVTWQQDASGNISAYAAALKIAVAPVAGVVTLDASAGNSFFITVNAAITSMVISNATDGQEITVMWQQDATGHAVAMASTMASGSFSVSTTASKTSAGKWSYNAANTIWYLLGQSGM